MKPSAVLVAGMALIVFGAPFTTPGVAQTQVTLSAACPAPGFFACELVGGLSKLITRDLGVQANLQRAGSFLEAMRSIVERRPISAS